MNEHAPPATEQAGRTTLTTPKPANSRRSGWRWLWLPIIVLFAAGAWYLWAKGGVTPAATTGTGAKSGKKGGGTVPVVASKARKGAISVYIDGLGSVTPIYTDTVKSRVDGQLMSVHYNEGDIVHKGDLLVEIDPRPYQVALDQAKAQMAKDQANLKNARVDLDRYTKLLAQNAVPEQQLATQQALVDQDAAVIQTDQAAIDSAQLNLVYCHITAEITGRIGLRLVDPGNIVHATDTNGLLVITQINPISAIFTVAEDDLPTVLKKLAAGQHLVAEAWDRGKTEKIGTGTLATVDNQIDPTTGSLRLRANFDNGQNRLFPNQFVNVRLLVEQRGGVTLVNRAVIQRSTTSVYVFAVQNNKTVTVRNITEGKTEGDFTEVTSGVSPGDILVMTGVDKLQEGTPVTVQLADDGSAGPKGAANKSTAAGKSGGKKK